MVGRMSTKNHGFWYSALADKGRLSEVGSCTGGSKKHHCATSAARGGLSRWRTDTFACPPPLHCLVRFHYLSTQPLNLLYKPFPG